MTTNPAPYINNEFIQIQINKAYAGMHTLKVQNNGNNYAQLKGNVYSFKNNTKRYKGIRTLKAVSKIFNELIDIHQNFIVDDVCYYYSRGSWKWYSVS